ncbi:MAG: hypothetical protein ABI960_03720 [Candidatus Eisenbacteria bacterium]
MNAMRRLSILFALLLLIPVAPHAAFAAGRGFLLNPTPNPVTEAPVRKINPSGVPEDCSLIGFEGVGNTNPVGTYVGPVTVTFGTSWLGVVDFDAGGVGNFANEPSPSTAASFLDQNDIGITLSPPVRFVQFQYTAAAQSLPVTVYAYDSSNNLIDTASGNVIGTSYDGANCTGDPNGECCLWDVVSLISATDNIASVKITGAVSNYFGIDNLYFCTSTTPTRPTTWGQLKSSYR